MHPVVKAALGVAVVSALGAPPPERARASAASDTAAPMAAPLTEHQPIHCPERTLRLTTGGSQRCVPLPEAESALSGGARAARLRSAPLSAAELRLAAPSEMIPRLPERSATWADYQLPVEPVIAVENPTVSEPPLLGVELVTNAGAPVTLIDLQNQVGQAEVVLVGDLYGVTVVLRQRVKSPEGERPHLVFYGHLDRPGPNIVNGARLGPMAVIGYVADAGDDEADLYFEVRREHGELSRPAEHLSQLVQSGVSAVVDARNVLPLRR